MKWPYVSDRRLFSDSLETLPRVITITSNSKQAELEVKKLSLTLKGIFLALLKNSQASIWEGRQHRTKVAGWGGWPDSPDSSLDRLWIPQ